jgi:hypothetical protein
VDTSTCVYESGVNPTSDPLATSDLYMTESAQLGEERRLRFSSRSYKKPYGSLNTLRGIGNSTILPYTGPRLHKFMQWVNVVDDVIDWPHNEIGKVENSILTCPSVQKWKIPSLKDKSFELHLIAFREKLLFWDKILEGRTSFMPPIEVAKRCIFLGPEFPGYIKDCIEDSLRFNTGLGDELKYEFADPDAWGHDYFFSPRDCLNFRLPDTQEDISRLLIKPPDVDPKFMKRLEREFRNFIKVPNHRVDLDDLDYLSLFNEKSTFISPEGPKRRTKNYIARIGKKVRPDEQLEFDYCFVQKNASEGRAAVIGKPGTLLKIKKFHKMFKAINNCPEDHYSNPHITKGLEKWLSIDSLRSGFIMSDIKKSGLTFNRNVFNMLIRILHELMPTWGWDEFHDYGKALLHLPDKSKPVPILNGFGLGMLDCVVSFTQACIYNILIEDYDTRAYRMDAKFWSDDSIIKVRMNLNLILDLDGLDELMSIFNELLSQCGIVVHNKKPYVSRLGVFLESYGTPYKCKWDSAKRGQYLGCLFDVLKAPDIFRAKEIFATLMLEVPKDVMPWASTALDTIVSFWGYEFHPDEVMMPFESGGWSYCVDEGWNTFISSAQEVEETDTNAKLIRLCNVHSLPRRTLKLHKKHEEYIQSIVDLGWAEDPTVHSWSVLAGSTLRQDYKSLQDIASIEKKILKRRQLCWLKPLTKHSDTEYGELLTFWDKIKKVGWYLPPRYRLKKRDFPYPGPLLPTKDSLASKISRERAWLHLTRSKGSDVSVIDPYIEYKSNMDVCSILLTSLTKGQHRSLDEVAFAILNNYDLEELYLKLLEVYGRDFTIIEISPEIDAVKDVLRGCMAPTKGNFVFPLQNTPYSILTDLEGESPLLRYPDVDSTGVAILFSNPYLNFTSWDFPLEARSYAQDATASYAQIVQGLRPSKALVEAQQDDDDYPDEHVQDLSYFREMLKGAIAHQTMGLDRDNEDPEPKILTITESYSSVFDEDDFEMPDLFG